MKPETKRLSFFMSTILAKCVRDFTRINVIFSWTIDPSLSEMASKTKKKRALSLDKTDREAKRSNSGEFYSESKVKFYQNPTLYSTISNTRMWPRDEWGQPWWKVEWVNIVPLLKALVLTQVEEVGLSRLIKVRENCIGKSWPLTIGRMPISNEVGYYPVHFGQLRAMLLTSNLVKEKMMKFEDAAKQLPYVDIGLACKGPCFNWYCALIAVVDMRHVGTSTTVFPSGFIVEVRNESEIRWMRRRISPYMGNFA